jgi:hypothetical protein
MKSELLGLLGAFVLAIGGVFMFLYLYYLQTSYFENVQSPYSLIVFLGFISFLFAGMGLWLIVLSGKKD